MGKKGGWEEKNESHNRQKISLLFFLRLGFCGLWVWYYFTTMQTRLGSIYSLLSLAIRRISLFLRKSRFQPSRKLRAAGSARLYHGPSTFVVMKNFSHLNASCGHLSLWAALTWFCSNKLKIPFQIIHLIETSGLLKPGLASVISFLKTHTLDHEIVELTRKKKWPVFLFPSLGFYSDTDSW